jgi:hypothetical protein
MMQEESSLRTNKNNGSTSKSNKKDKGLNNKNTNKTCTLSKLSNLTE